MARVIEETGDTHIIHEHTDGSGSNSLMLILELVLLAIFVFIFYYGLPALKSTMSPQINVPGQVDVNVNRK